MKSGIEMPQEAAYEALSHYAISVAGITRYGTGLINDTYRVTDTKGRQFILQRMNPAIDPRVNLAIDVVTRHLEQIGAPTQRLIPLAEGNGLWVEVNGRNWRLMTFVPGVCFDQLRQPAQAQAAGALLGRFHRLVDGVDVQLRGERLGVHDTARHLAGLRAALEEHRDHRYYDVIRPLAEAVLEAAAALPRLPDLPDRLVHGDPKISNLVFDEQTGEGVCMIDLDTLARMPVPLEMGDAIRSWCNPKGEDETQAQFRIDFFRAAVEGYAAETRELLQPDEWRAFVPAARTIMVELAARFTRDALREAYFGWNPEKFPDRSTHNQIRARGQLNLHKEFCTCLDEAEDIVAQAFGD